MCIEHLNNLNKYLTIDTLVNKNFMHCDKKNQQNINIKV